MKTLDNIEKVRAQLIALYPPLITTVEAAAIARKPLETIYDWSSRLLEPIKHPVGRSVLFERDAFIDFVLLGEQSLPQKQIN